MPKTTTLVLQGVTESEVSVYAALSNSAMEGKFDEAVFVTPFATEQGVRMLIDVAEKAEVGSVEWLVGLDQVITTPKALEAILGSNLSKHPKAWKPSYTLPNLHAKLYLLFSVEPCKLVLYVGSSNATPSGLVENLEAGVLVERKGTGAKHFRAEVEKWLKKAIAGSPCVHLTTRLVTAYRGSYKPPRGRIKRVARLVGAVRESVRKSSQTGKYAWIEVAVRGGSSNQIEICKDMAPFFTGGGTLSRVDLTLVHAATGQAYSQNSYRFRAGNVGYRVEVETNLARTMDLKSASRRRDVILFRKTQRPNEYTVELLPAKAKATQELVKQSERANEIKLTTTAPGGRKYRI